MLNQATILFPCIEEEHEDIDDSETRRFTLNEVQAAVSQLGNKHSPGPDGIPLQSTLGDGRCDQL